MAIKKIKAPIGDENKLALFNRVEELTIKKIKAPIGDENCFQSLSKHSFIAFIKKIKAPIGDENNNQNFL